MSKYEERLIDAADKLIAAILETGGLGSPRHGHLKEASNYMKLRELPISHYKSIVRDHYKNDEGGTNGS